MSASRERLEELLRAVEVAHADAHRAEALRDVRVRAGAADDPVLGGEAHRLLVEGRDRDARVEDLDRVDVLDDLEQVLVVGHGVHAVERVRHVDEPALAPDLGDRLLERQPARDLLLDEEADHLALVGGLDLLADDHLDAVLRGLGARVERAGDLVVVGHRDRAEAASRAVASSTSTGVAQSCEWSVCMCRSTSISLRPASRARARRRRRGRVAAGRDLGVERLEARRRRRPGELGRAAARRARAAAQRVVAQQPLELGGQRRRRRRARTAGRARRRASTSS